MNWALRYVKEAGSIFDLLEASRQMIAMHEDGENHNMSDALSHSSSADEAEGRMHHMHRTLADMHFSASGLHGLARKAWLHVNHIGTMYSTDRKNRELRQMVRDANDIANDLSDRCNSIDSNITDEYRKYD